MWIRLIIWPILLLLANSGELLYSEMVWRLMTCKTQSVPLRQSLVVCFGENTGPLCLKVEKSYTSHSLFRDAVYHIINWKAISAIWIKAASDFECAVKHAELFAIMIVQSHLSWHQTHSYPNIFFMMWPLLWYQYMQQYLQLSIYDTVTMVTWRAVFMHMTSNCDPSHTLGHMCEKCMLLFSDLSDPHLSWDATGFWLSQSC